MNKVYSAVIGLTFLLVSFSQGSAPLMVFTEGHEQWYINPEFTKEFSSFALYIKTSWLEKIEYFMKEFEGEIVFDADQWAYLSEILIHNTVLSLDLKKNINSFLLRNTNFSLPKPQESVENLASSPELREDMPSFSKASSPVLNEKEFLGSDFLGVLDD